MSIGTNITTLIAIGVAAVAGIVVAYGGFMYATAMGDPQKVGIAKNAFVGAFVGLMIASLAFVGPRIVTNMVIKPVGGIAMESEVGLNCDGVLRNQLVFQRGASTTSRIQVLISQIQSRHQECASDVWKPVVIDMGAAAATTGIVAAGGTDATGQCYYSAGGFTAGVADDDIGDIKIGSQSLPSSLIRSGAPDKNFPRTTSGRDSDNNIVVYWGDITTDRPSDAASCWLYYSRLNSWHENFIQ